MRNNRQTRRPLTLFNEDAGKKYGDKDKCITITEALGHNFWQADEKRNIT
jgi:hypothetical protein